MKRHTKLCLIFLCFIVLSGCVQSEATDSLQDKVKIGIMLADYGLGDQSFNDSAFTGLMKARDELGIVFEYRQLDEVGTYQQGFQELIDENCDLIIGLGFNVIEAITEIATENREQPFLFIDGVIDLPNVTSVTFRDEEGSFIVGTVAGLKTESDTVGFIGGMDIPVINRIEQGFVAGVKEVSPNTTIAVEYASDFGDAEKGKELAQKLINAYDADIIYVAAGFTGLGAIEEIAENNRYAIGVDSDQFFVSETAIITSMLKKIDVAIFKAIETFLEHGSLTENHMELGLLEDGVGAAPIRIISLSEDEKEQMDKLVDELIHGSISINP